MRDASGHHAPGWTLVPIAPFDGVHLTAPSMPRRSTTVGSDEWSQIAINCVGRSAESVLLPETEAGLDQDGWRQTYWNPLSAGLCPNLFDAEGRVTGVSFTTGVWYMSPWHAPEGSSDEVLTAGWCKNKTHRLDGLTPEARYDLAVYLYRGPSRHPSALPDGIDRVTVSALHEQSGRPLRLATNIGAWEIRVRRAAAFSGFVPVNDAGAASQGNVLLIRDVPASETGTLTLTVQVATLRGTPTRVVWQDAELCGLQIRPAAK